MQYFLRQQERSLIQASALIAAVTKVKEISVRFRSIIYEALRRAE